MNYCVPEGGQGEEFLVRLGGCAWWQLALMQEVNRDYFLLLC
ncbi:hypothetical protein [Chlorogloeopsis sp. ULAP02]